MGEALLLVCALAKAAGVDPELALNGAADRFVDRFEALEKEIIAAGESLPVEDEKIGKYWDRVKLHENM
jgi:uncharacterized protein YabN with tetrapyrrole methylase and pyrophosphatase domain